MDLQEIIGRKKVEILDLIKNYKEYIRRGGLKSEEYKWLLFEKQKGLPILDKETIVDELCSLDYGNLMFHNAIGVMKHLRIERKEQYANALISFYDEGKSLKERINLFDEEVLSIYRELLPNFGHHHDERTMSLLLSFKYPEKYVLYKNSFYVQLCRLLEIKTKSKNNKYLHYLELVDIIKSEFIENDRELLVLVGEHLPLGCYNDPNHNLLVQDFLYTMLNKNDNTYELFSEVKTLFKERVQKNNSYSIAVGSDENKDFLRIGDKHKIIGTNHVHYELYCDKSSIYIDLHLERANSRSSKIISFLKDLYVFLDSKNYSDVFIEFINWEDKEENYKSIRFKKEFPLEREELLKVETIDEMIQCFVILDKIIGYDVREFLINNSTIDTRLVEKYKTKKVMNIPLNQILYGPPGTGKTYNTINKAVQIANSGFIIDDSLNANEKRKLIKEEYHRLVDEGQILFTTFHQSMTYEDFIEGIKPVIEENGDDAKSVIYDVKNGIFKEICKNARKSQFEKFEVVKKYSFDDAFNDLVLEANQKLENNEQLFLPILTENLALRIVGISDRGNLILKPKYSEDSKEYIVSYNRAEKLQQAYPDLSVVKNINKEFRAVIGGSNATAYWSVLNYINNKINSEIVSSSQSVVLPHKPYVLIIDEINRGNVSQIFGELITLIEEDKRLGNDEAIEVILPYSKEKFGVPSNLFIIGTMNTADRSVEALDTALRRRFVFEEMPPKYDLNGLQQNLYGFKSFEILQTLNKRIEKLLDRDHQIGHAYFFNKNESTIIDSFYKNIIPLLQEYFFGDYGKIGLVLGAGFVRKIKQDSVFANFEYLDYSLFEEKESYKILGLNDEDFNFENAIKLLMNKI